jgi:hypothetical protein
MANQVFFLHPKPLPIILMMKKAAVASIIMVENLTLNL